MHGLAACTENVEYSLHMAEDVRRHSTLDNYWCYLYERLVKFYKHQTTNMKAMCKTFSDRAHQLHFVQAYLEVHGEYNTANEEYKLEELKQEPVLLCAKTIPQAIALKEYLAEVLDLPDDLKRSYQNGILIGTPRQIVLNQRQMNDVIYWLSQRSEFDLVPEELPDVAYSYPRVLKVDDLHQATVYRLDEHIALRDMEVTSQEWVMQIRQLFVYGPINKKYYSFVDGNYYKAKSRQGEIVTDPWTGQPMMVPQNYQCLCVQPMEQIDRKLMLYPKPCPNNPQYYLVIDPNPSIDLDSWIDNDDIC